jgi:hypothetical protein
LEFFSHSASATHAMGGELNYKWISGNTYEFTYTFYRDCMGIAAPVDVQVVLNSITCGVDSQAYDIPLVDYGDIPSVCSGLQTVCSGGTYTRL